MDITNKDRVNTYKHFIKEHNEKIEQLQMQLRNEKSSLLNTEVEFVHMLSICYNLEQFLGKPYFYAKVQVFEDSDIIFPGILANEDITEKFKNFTPYAVVNGEYLNDALFVHSFDIEKDYVLYVTYTEMYDEMNYHKDPDLVLRDTPLSQRDIAEYLILEVK